MIFAAVIGNGNGIVPIVEGETLRIFNVDTNQFEDYANPALQVTVGRRGAALAFAEEKGVTAFISPPETFCELSYDKARHIGIRFIPVASGLNFDEFQEQIKHHSLQLSAELPSNEIVPSI